MKKQLTLLTLSILFAVGKVGAQSFTPIATTGYTLDAVADGSTVAQSTDHAIDGSGYVLYSQAYGQTISTSAYGLPNNGVIASTSRTFQLQPYNAKNMLYLPTGNQDSLSLVTPAAYPAISLVGFATEGSLSSQVYIKVRFTDNTSQNYTITMTDWFSITSNIAAQGFDRMNSSGTPDYNSTNPKMSYFDLAIACANQGKAIKRIIIQNGGSNPRVCIMGVAANVPSYSITASSLVTCGTNVTITATGLGTTTWQPVGSFTGATTSSIVVTPTSNTTYTLVGSTTTGTCPAGGEVTINAATGTPTLSLAGSSSTVCLGGAATLSVSGALSYTLSNGLNNGASFTPTATGSYTASGSNGCGTSSVVTTITVTPLPVTAVASNTLVCSGSTLALTGSGATSYSWTPGSSSSTVFVVSPSANTTYTLKGLIGACTGSTTVSVSTKPNPTLTIASSATAVCVGNSANLTVTGNADTYTWSVNNQNNTTISVSPTVVTLYSVIGTNSLNCTSAANIALLVNNSPTVTAAVSNPTICAGDPSTLTATGADSYAWTSGDLTSTAVVNPVTSTTYSVTGTSTAGCVSEAATVDVSVFIPTIGVSANASICKGVNITISANGADTYVWSNGAGLASINVSPTLTTVYTVTGSVTDPNSFITCTATNTVQVTVNPNPTVTATASQSVICKNTTATLTAGGADTYTWTGGSGAVQSSTMAVSPIANQTYSVAGTDANGCKSSTVIAITLSPCTGIATIAANANLVVYPNPTNGNFTISGDQAMTLVIVNETGQLVKSIKLDESNDHKVSVEGLSSGLYFIQSTDGSLAVKQKIMITK